MNPITLIAALIMPPMLAFLLSRTRLESGAFTTVSMVQLIVGLLFLEEETGYFALIFGKLFDFTVRIFSFFYGLL